MKAYGELATQAQVFPARTQVRAFRRFTFEPPIPAPAPRRIPSEHFVDNDSTASTPRSVERALIYVVDDEPDLTGLYTLFLKGTGYTVQAFNHRARALAALALASEKPDLLVMDYLGHTMPVDRFIHGCRVAHPDLPVLVASGLCLSAASVSRLQPARFLQKPFTACEFLREVRASLVALKR